MNRPDDAVPAGEIPAAADAVLRAAGIVGGYRIFPLAGGRNNRVFRVETAAGPVLLKSYFHDPSDSRDRLRQEVEFVRYGWVHGVRSLPRCLHADREHRLALFEFVEGRKLGRDEIDAGFIDQAAAFFRGINASRQSPEGLALLPASEACFTVRDHVAAVERRIARLAGMEENLPVDIEARAFAADLLIPFWHRLAAGIGDGLRGGTLPGSPLPEGERCLSPSDFGFHNALCDAAGRLRFLDFEYAGWDDPAKLIADFVNQPDLILPDDLGAHFTQAILAGSADPGVLAARLRWLIPLYQVKWACIILNDFLPMGRRRRHFTDGGREEPVLKRDQLEKARGMMARAVAALPS